MAKTTAKKTANKTAKKKLRIGVLFGGRSGEHEVSLLSAASVLKAIDKKKYDVVPIGITKDGQWVMAGDAERLLTGKANEQVLAEVIAQGEPLLLPPVPSTNLLPDEGSGLGKHAQGVGITAVDAVFPVLHGTFGEDGTIQGLFELADIAYVGSGVLGSAAGMDKDVMKRLFASAGLPITKHLTFLRNEWVSSPKKATAKIEAALKYPLFVKPANLGRLSVSPRCTTVRNWRRLWNWPVLSTARSWWSRVLAAARAEAGHVSLKWPCWAMMRRKLRWSVRLCRARSSTITRPST